MSKFWFVRWIKRLHSPRTAPPAHPGGFLRRSQATAPPARPWAPTEPPPPRGSWLNKNTFRIRSSLWILNASAVTHSQRGLENDVELCEVIAAVNVGKLYWPQKSIWSKHCSFPLPRFCFAVLFTWDSWKVSLSLHLIYHLLYKIHRILFPGVWLLNC